MQGLAGSQGNSLRMRISMDGPTLWPIVKLGAGPKIQFSAKIRRRIAKSSLIYMKAGIGKNDILSQLIELTKRTFPYPGPAQGDTPSPGP